MRELIVVRGGGDIATGCVQKLYRAGFRVAVLETELPTAIRRGAALSEAVYRGGVTVEDIKARHCAASEAEQVLDSGVIPVLADPEAAFIRRSRPLAVVDAILAKKNLGTHRGMAEITIGLGPGFTASDDVDIVIETMRGHDLGRLIFNGPAMANTGTPAPVKGVGAERVIYAPNAGRLQALRAIGDTVESGQLLARIGDTPVFAPISGILRGILPDGFETAPGLKLADIDPRLDQRKNCFTVSDKARCIGGAVLEAVMYKRR